MKMGFWSAAPLGFYSDNILGIRLTPEKPLKKYQIVFYNDSYQECFTFAPNLPSIYLGDVDLDFLKQF